MKPYRLLRAALCAALVAAAPVMAQPSGDLSRLSSQYASWAGSKTNADALVGGLNRGAPVTLVTTAPDRSVSLAGFTPSGPMSYAQIRAALSNAQQSLSKLGIAHPSAEQIQAALIGGEITLPNGATRQVAGVVGAQGPAPVALR